MTKYATILADPPWSFSTWSDKGRDRCPDARHYPVMDLDAIKSLRPRIDEWAAPDCVLFLWCTWPMLQKGLEVIDAWGFKYSTVGFVWAKTQKTDESRWAVGTGYWTRANTEYCLLARRGAPKRQAKDVHQLIVEPRANHSAKPIEVFDRIERLVPGPYLELFARPPHRPGWAVWGNDAEDPIEAPQRSPASAAATAPLSPS